MASRDPAERRSIARLGGLAARARGIDTQPARDALWAKWLAKADAVAGGRTQDPLHREELARELRRAHLARQGKAGAAKAAATRARKRQERIAAARKAADAELARRGNGATS